MLKTKSQLNKIILSLLLAVVVLVWPVSASASALTDFVQGFTEPVNNAFLSVKNFVASLQAPDLPKLSLPQIKVPKITLPTISLPKLGGDVVQNTTINNNSYETNYNVNQPTKEVVTIRETRTDSITFKGTGSANVKYDPSTKAVTIDVPSAGSDVTALQSRTASLESEVSRLDSKLQQVVSVPGIGGSVAVVADPVKLQAGEHIRLEPVDGGYKISASVATIDRGYVFGQSAAWADSSTNPGLWLNKTGASGDLIKMQVNGVDRFVVDNVGNVNINTTNLNGQLNLVQATNGQTMFAARRATDSAPAGDFISYSNAANDTQLFRVDNAGNIYAGGISNSGSITITSTSTPQLAVEYDPSNRITTSVSNVGTTTIAANGTTPRITWMPQSNRTDSFEFQNASGTPVATINTTTPGINVAGNVQTGGTTRIDASGNLSNIGTVSSGAITSSATIRVADGTATAPTYAFNSETNSGMYIAGGQLSFASGGTRFAYFGGSGLVMTQGQMLALDGTASAPGIGFANDVGEGIYRPGVNRLGVSTSGVGRWEWNASGHFITVADNSYDIGASGATRPRTGYFGTSVSAPSIITDSGALNVTPAAGSNLNVNLSTTGDFVVNTNRFYIDTSLERTGIGTTTPDEDLQIVDEADNSILKITTHSDTVADESVIQLGRTRGTEVLSTATLANDELGSIVAQGWDTALGAGARIDFDADADWGTAGDATDHPTRIIFSTVADGSSTMNERLRIGSNGDVGVNATSNMSSKFDVVGDATLDTEHTYGFFRGGGSTQPGIRIGGNNATDANIRYGFIQSITPSGSAKNLNLQPNGGNIGIGTVAPLSALHVSRTGSFSGVLVERTDGKFISIGGGANTPVINFDDSSPLTFNKQSQANKGTSTGQTELMRIDSSGNVGIGTIGPSSILELESNAVTGPRLTLTNIHSTSINTSLRFAQGASSTRNWDITTDYDGDGGTELAIVGADAAQKMTFLQNGNVGIGTADIENWGGARTALQMGYASALNFHTTAPFTSLTNNAYYDSVNDRWEYRVTDEASRFEMQSDGSIVLESAVSGAADAPITWLNAITINSSAQVGMGMAPNGFKLDVAGNVRVNDSIHSPAELFLRPGNNTVSLYDNVNSYTFRIFNGATEAVNIKANGSSWFNGGNVGIGTTGPNAKLQVHGGNAYISQATDPTLILSETEAATAGTYGGIYWDDATDTVRLFTQAGGDTLRLSESGIIGIGGDPVGGRLSVTDSFSGYSGFNANIGQGSYGFLEINSSASADDGDVPYISLHRGGSTAWQMGLLGDNFVIANGGGASTENVFAGSARIFNIENTGQVGIGTTSPNANLESLGTTEQLRLSYNSTIHMPFTVDSSGLMTIGDGNSGASTFNQFKLQGRVIATEKPMLELAPAIRPTSIIAAAYGLKITPTVIDQIVGNEATDYYGLHISTPTGGGQIGNIYGAYIQGRSFLAGLGTGTGGNYLCIDTTTSEVLRGNGAACTASSLRFKENIQDLNYGLAEVLNLHPVSYNYKAGTNMGEGVKLGFIAEEMQQILPEVVTTDANGQTFGLDYPVLTSVLTKAVQELNTKVDSLNQTGGAEQTIANVVEDLQINTTLIVNGSAVFKGGILVEGKLVTVELETKKARIEKLEMVDQGTGDIWCTYIFNGEWVKEQGACVDTTPVVEPTPEEPAPTEEPSGEVAGESAPDEPVTEPETVEPVTTAENITP